jgi:hypothetical protein
MISVKLSPRRGPGPATRALIGVGLLLSLFAGCGREKKDDFASVEQLDFSVNPSLLGPAVTDSSARITLRPPVFMLAVDPARFADIQERARSGQRSGDPFAFEPIMFFAKPDGASYCTVARFLHPPPGGMNREWIDRCRGATRKMVAPAEVKDDMFRTHDLVVLQFVILTPQLAMFRLICQGPGPAPVRVDYVVPRAEYQAQVDAIESSIGSLQLF